MILMVSGCQTFEKLNLFNSKQKNLEGFYPEKVFVQSSFTQVKTPEEAGSEPVIEAYVGLKDQFEDPMKRLGIFRFELYPFKKASPDPRGKRFKDKGLQTFNLTAASENQRHWDKVSRAYSFELALPAEARETRQIVVEVTFTDHLKPIRLQDRLNLKFTLD